jgi:hypothetical protein
MLCEGIFTLSGSGDRTGDWRDRRHGATPDPRYRHRFPAEIIGHTVRLHHVFSLRLRDVELLLAERSVCNVGLFHVEDFLQRSARDVRLEIRGRETGLRVDMAGPLFQMRVRRKIPRLKTQAIRSEWLRGPIRPQYFVYSAE